MSQETPHHANIDSNVSGSEYLTGEHWGSPETREVLDKQAMVQEATGIRDQYNGELFRNMADAVESGGEAIDYVDTYGDGDNQACDVGLVQVDCKGEVLADSHADVGVADADLMHFQEISPSYTADNAEIILQQAREMRDLGS